MKRLLFRALAAWGTAAALVAPVHAGRDCEARLPDAAAVQRGMDLAERTARALDATGVGVVVLARAGQDLSRHGLRWSHLGLAYRDDGQRWREGGRGPAAWRVVHKLNHCGSAHADLFRQGLGQFFLDDPHEYRAALLVLTPELQDTLKPLLTDNRRAAQLHEPAYNMLAYPWAQRYQQSNQWAIETLALAADPQATTRERAQAWLRLRGYEPTALKLGALTRLGARATAANIAFDDHPSHKRFADRIETVSVDSVFEWLQRSGLARGGVVVVR